jgi:SOS response regulatory protein OraA/RecX
MPDGPDRTLVARREEPGAVVLELDGGETLRIAPDAVPDDLPDVGGSLGSPLLVSLRAAAARKEAARDLLRLLDRKLWTTGRLRRKLVELGHAPDAADAVLAQAQERGLQSDDEFAAAFCRDTLRRKAVGRVWLAARLREKGLDGDVARDAADLALGSARERELAEQAARERWRRERGRDRSAEARVARFLASRGFPAGACRDAARAARPDAADDGHDPAM